jgi:hypothetical protein
MDALNRAAELIDRALDSLALAAIRNPDLRADFAKRCERLRLLMDEVEATQGRNLDGGADRA